MKLGVKYLLVIAIAIVAYCIFLSNKNTEAPLSPTAYPMRFSWWNIPTGANTVG